MMTNTRLLLRHQCVDYALVSLLLLSVPSFVLAQAVPSWSTGAPKASLANAAEAVDQLAQDVMTVARLPALSIAILEPDSSGALAIAHAKAFGLADAATDTPATTESRFRAASVSKVIAVTGLARLVAQGKIDWDTELSSLDIDFPEPGGITPRRLAGHLAGIGHYQPQDKIERWGQVESAIEALAAFRDSPRVGPPGAQYRYTTHGITLLTAMMEAASDRTFPELIDEQVNQPLGLKRTGPAPAAQGADGMATLYMIGSRGILPLPRPENPSYKWGGGGMASTPSDLVTIGAVYLDRDRVGGRAFLPPELIDEMWTPQQVDGESTGVGIVWRIAREPGSDRQLVHHAGSMQGARSLLMLFPEERRALSIMTNASWSSDIERTGSVLMAAWRAAREATDSAPGRTTLAVPSNGDRGALAMSKVQLVQRDPSAENVADEGAPTFDAVEAGVRAQPGRVDALPLPGGFEAVARQATDSLRIVQVADDDWTLVTPRGLARGQCESSVAGEDGASRAGTASCRFEVSRQLDLVVELRPQGD